VFVGQREAVAAIPALAEHRIPAALAAVRVDVHGSLESGPEVDVVLHLHGFAPRPELRDRYRIEDAVGPSGFHLEWPVTQARPRPLVLVMLRGAWTGGRDGRAYGFPALALPSGQPLEELIALSLRMVSPDRPLRPVRRILTAHSGGCAAAARMLGREAQRASAERTAEDKGRVLTIHEAFLHDGVYEGSVPPLQAWLREAQGVRLEDGAFCVTYRAASAEAVRKNSERAVQGMVRHPRWRAFRTDMLDHDLMATRYNAALLADPAAVLDPGQRWSAPCRPVR
jgi:hypothetical protein